MKTISKGGSQNMGTYYSVSYIAFEILEYYFMVFCNKLKLYVENVKVTINEGGTFYVNSVDKIEY